MGKKIDEDGYFGDDFQVLFYGWTYFNNSKFKDFQDEIEDNREWREDPETTFTNPKTGQKVAFNSPFPKEGKEEYIDRLYEYMAKAELVLKNRCMIKGIKFDGNYHQNGDYGTPIFRVIDPRNEEVYDKFFLWTCTFRYWGGIMEDAGHGKSYMDWAWNNLGEPVYPNQVEGEKCVATEN